MSSYSFPLDEALTYLKDLISIPSVSGEEQAIGIYLEDKLRGFGADQVSRIGSEDRFSVCAHITGSTPGPHILMTGHIDTVPPGDGWTCDPFTPLLRDGRIYGRGSNDMKGGISIILTVFHWACQHREQLSGKLSVVLVPDEEKFSTGVQQVLQSGFSADFALSAEPSYGKLIIGAVGKVLIQGDFIGKRAHGSEPQNGINAISEAAVLTAHLNQLPPPACSAAEPQPYVPLRIQGGETTYFTDIPDHCTILINKHTVPGESWDYIYSDLNQLVQDLPLKCSVSFQKKSPFYPPYALSEDHPELLRLKSLYEQVLQHPVQMIWDDGVSDNNCWVGTGGIPTVCLGPSGEGMHGPNEWVSVDEIQQCGQTYLEYILHSKS